MIACNPRSTTWLHVATGWVSNGFMAATKFSIRTNARGGDGVSMRLRPAPSAQRERARSSPFTRQTTPEFFARKLPVFSQSLFSRMPQKRRNLLIMKWWAGLDSNQRRRKPADLQSAPFSHSGTYPFSQREGGRIKGVSLPLQPEFGFFLSASVWSSTSPSDGVTARGGSWSPWRRAL